MSEPWKDRWESPNGEAVLLLGDCEPILATMADGSFDCVVTDPPYGIDYDNAGGFSEQCGWRKFEKLGWDKERPRREAFDQLRRVSKEQVIWGGNYFTDYLPPTMQWLVWDKGQRDFTLADCEFAWSSQYRGARICNLPRAVANQEQRFHPTQKPIALVGWCLEQIRPQPQSVLDPFMGSASTIVAAVRRGIRAVGIEREESYFAIARKRIEEELGRFPLFQEPRPTQGDLFKEGAA